MRLGGLSDPLNPLARAMGSALRPQRKEGAPAVATDNGWCCNSASKVESYDDEDVKARLMESGVSPPQSPGADSAGGDDDGEKMQWKTWKGSARILGEGEEEGDTLTAAAAGAAGPAAASTAGGGGGGDTPSHEEGGAAAALEEDEGRSSAEPAQQDSTTAASSTAEDFTLPSSALLQRSNAMIEQRERESPPSVRSSRSARSARSHGSRRSMPGPIRGSHGSLPSSARSGASTTSIAAASTKTKAKKSKSKLGKGATTTTTTTTTAKPKTKTKMKSKTKSPSAAPAQPSPDPKLLELATAGAEILPPYGVLRVTLDTEDDVTKLVEALDDGYKLIVDDLKAAATALGEKTCGLLFQALVVQGVAQRVAGNQPSNTPILPPSPEKKDSNMHVGREDNVAGKGKINLKKVPGGRKASALLAARAMNVVQLLRIKLEDDGDLAQAKKTLANCRTFFSKLGDVGKELGFASLHETVQQLNAI